MRRAESDQLTRTLNHHLNTVHETFQVLDQTAPSKLEKVSWVEVTKMGDQVSKQATIFGMLWTGGETPQVRALEENMVSYFNTLQGFLLLSHGSTVGAGPMLASCVHMSVKQVVDISFKLCKESIFLDKGGPDSIAWVVQLSDLHFNVHHPDRALNPFFARAHGKAKAKATKRSVEKEAKVLRTKYAKMCILEPFGAILGLK
ncbi:hypothetical protein ACFX15_022468 [Malus domestica]